MSPVFRRDRSQNGENVRLLCPSACEKDEERLVSPLLPFEPLPVPSEPCCGPYVQVGGGAGKQLTSPNFLKKCTKGAKKMFAEVLGAIAPKTSVNVI